MTGAIFALCPEPGCAIWTPHSHTGVLVAPIPQKECKDTCAKYGRHAFNCANHPTADVPRHCMTRTCREQSA